MPRLVVASLLAACAFSADSTPQTTEAQPAAPAVVTAATPTAPTSEKVGEALRKFSVRVRIATASGSAAPTEAAKADLRARLIAIDELVEADGDAPAILAAGRAACLIPAAITDYASAMALLRASGQATAAKTAEPVAVAPKAPEVPAKPAAEPAAPAAKLVAGVKCRLYTIPGGEAWPPKGLPQIPVATVSLPALTDVEPAMVNRPAPFGTVCNRLIEHSALDGARYYAVEYTGFLHANADGVFGVTIESDDPFVVSLENNEIGRSDWYIKQTEWVGIGSSTDAFNHFAPKEQRTARVVSATPSLVKGRAYAFRLVCFQSWKSSARINDNSAWSPNLTPEKIKEWSPVVTGATLRVRVIAPDSEPVPIRLYLPEATRARREE